MAFKDKYFRGEKFKSSQTLCNFATMNIEELREFCLSLEFTTEEVQWEDVLLFKVGGKMFCFTALNESFKMNLKCDPDEAIELRDRFAAVLPGYHMNKKYWNTVLVDGTISDNMLKIWIKNSYSLVKAKLTKQEQARLASFNDLRK